MQPAKFSLFLTILLLFAATAVAQPECPPFHIFTGEAAGDALGISVASAGDVNNDGYADLIVGARWNDAGGFDAGRAYVFSGLNGDTLYVFTGESSGDRFGVSVASAGDVNSDGYADLIVGARNAGANVFSGLNGDTLYVFTGESPGDRFGVSVASAGDVNNDGYDDMIVGAPSDGLGRGAGWAYVFSGIDGDTLYVFSGEAEFDNFGESVASAGDVNNDGYADLIVGAFANDAGGNGAGRAYVFSGRNGDTLHVFTGEAGDLLGFSVASAGDVNNDGYADLIVGHISGVFITINRAYVFSGLTGDTLFVLTAEAAGDNFGISVAPAGDVNNDGYADLIVGAPGNVGGGDLAGRAYVFSGLNGDALHVFTGEANFDVFGGSVASAGDVNGDGFDDLIVGARSNDAGGAVAGRAYVFLGGEFTCGDVDGDELITQDDLTFLINFYFSYGEVPCGFAGDVNDDGFTNLADIVYLAQYLNNNGPAPCAASEPPPSLFDPKKKPEGRQAGSNGY